MNINVKENEISVLRESLENYRDVIEETMDGLYEDTDEDTINEYQEQLDIIDNLLSRIY